MMTYFVQPPPHNTYQTGPHPQQARYRKTPASAVTGNIPLGWLKWILPEQILSFA